MSQAELARAIGVSKATIVHYEHGRAEIRATRLELIAVALHCQVPDLSHRSMHRWRAQFRAGPVAATAYLMPISALLEVTGAE
jgi:transcriptional regulator with XRE-family HTH domain